MGDLALRGDGESWESYARRLEHRVKEQRDHIKAIQAIHGDKGNKADRKRLRALEATLGSMTLRWERQREATHALSALAWSRDLNVITVTPESSQRALALLSPAALARFLADVAIAVAYRRTDIPTPQQVLREGAALFAWPESEWPVVRARIDDWLGSPPEEP